MRLYDSLDLAFALWELDRPLDAIANAVAANPKGPWDQVTGAITRGELIQAADRLAGFGARTLEAYVRLRAAEQLVAKGEAAAAEAQLERAVAFYRSVGATFFILRGEQLLAKSA